MDYVGVSPTCRYIECDQWNETKGNGWLLWSYIFFFLVYHPLYWRENNTTEQCFKAVLPFACVLSVKFDRGWRIPIWCSFSKFFWDYFFHEKKTFCVKNRFVKSSIWVEESNVGIHLIVAIEENGTGKVNEFICLFVSSEKNIYFLQFMKISILAPNADLIVN